MTERSCVENDAKQDTRRLAVVGAAMNFARDMHVGGLSGMSCLVTSGSIAGIVQH